MPANQPAWIQPLITVGQVFFGFVLAVTPVTLWIAWSPFVFFVAVAVVAVSAGMFVLLHHFEQQTGVGGAAAPGHRPGASLPDEFIEELQQIYPLTYHHSLHARARFRQAMEKLRRLAN